MPRINKFVSGRNPKEYTVNEDSFQIINGNQKYNRVLYGAIMKNYANRFRVIAGDLPELMMYLPGDGGRCFFGIENNNGSKWLTKAEYIKTSYKDGGMIYNIKDRLICEGEISLHINPIYNDTGIAI